jgi:hypothetical protein
MEWGIAMGRRAKTLWVVNYNSVQEFLAKAVAVGATAVAIRTDNGMCQCFETTGGWELVSFGNG